MKKLPVVVLDTQHIYLRLQSTVSVNNAWTTMSCGSYTIGLYVYDRPAVHDALVATMATGVSCPKLQISFGYKLVTQRTSTVDKFSYIK